MADITITVDKVVLLKRLQENRAGHGEAYAKAWDGYLRMMRGELEDKLTRIKAGKPIDHFLGNQPPDDHTKDYDVVIEMMEMSIGDTIDLTQGQFRQYVQDDWGWKQAWSTSNTQYIEASAL